MPVMYRWFSQYGFVQGVIQILNRKEVTDFFTSDLPELVNQLWELKQSENS